MNDVIGLDALILLSQAMEEQVVILGPEGLIHANQPASELFGKELDQLLGITAEELLIPPPASPEKGQSASILGRIKAPRGEGPMVRGLALGLSNDLQIWVMQGQASLVDLGSLAAGLIHNLAGPLSVIRSSAELLERFQGKALESSPELSAELETWPQSVKNGFRIMVEHVDQITEATRDLLAKVRGESARREGPLDLNDILLRELRFAENNLGLKQHTRQEVNLAPQLPLVQGLYSDFSQSFRNLLRNAVQAMAESQPKILKVSTGLQGKAILVQIQDSGKGISPKDLPRVFDPFFTTRSAGSQASGLGLYSVRQLLMPYKVGFEIESKPGRTLFTLTVPVTREQDHV
jgi:two-component system NtrC family sensor kinase